MSNTTDSANQSGAPDFSINSILRPTADHVWRGHLLTLLRVGYEVETRGRKVRELLAGHTIMDMNYPVLQEPQRKVGYRFMAAESRWILTGDNRVKTILPYAPGIANYSDDGARFDGAYGPKVIDQLRYVVDSLHKDNSTRQAIIGIWRDNPRDSKDLPCTLALQFLIREGALSCIATMRSQDVWLGWPYDSFNFTMISSYVLLELSRRTGHQFRLGRLHIRQGSFHLYEDNVREAENLKEPTILNPMKWNPHLYKSADFLITDLDYAADNMRGVMCLVGLNNET